MDQTTIEPQPAALRAGWSIERYAEATGVSRAMLYALPPAKQPQFVKIGRRRIIVEPPAAWLQRVGETNAAVLA
jgi:hypothetical protein